MEPTTPTRADRCISYGAALYWAASILSLTSWRLDRFPEALYGIVLGISSLVVVATAALCLLRAHAFARPAVQKALAGTAVACDVASLAAYRLMPVDNAAATVFVALLRGVCYGGFVLFWGLNFATLGKRTAEATVLRALFASCALYLVLAALPLAPYGGIVACAMKAVSVVPFLAGRYRMPMRDRRLAQGWRTALVPFVASRVFLGASIGSLLFLSPTAWPGDVPACVPCCAVALAAVALAGLLLARKPAGVRLLNVAPLIILGTMASAYAVPLGEARACAVVAGASAWLAWIAFSSTQVSDLKDRIGMHEATLTFIDKTVTLGTCLVAYFVVMALHGLLPEQWGEEATAHATFALLYAAVTASCLLFAKLLGTKEVEVAFDKGARESGERMRRAVEGVASAASLTKREAEILNLLVEGRSRSYICQHFAISEGTARTHISHVYQKLGVHGKDEARALVEGALDAAP